MITPASTFAGEFIFGSINKFITLVKIASTPRIGLHLSSAFSPDKSSLPGGCNIDIHTFPSLYTNKI